jgi:hypothetical protein
MGIMMSWKVYYYPNNVNLVKKPNYVRSRIRVIFKKGQRSVGKGISCEPDRARGISGFDRQGSIVLNDDAAGDPDDVRAE